MMLVFPAGYFFFWGDRLASGFAYLSGPVYFIPLFVPLCLFIATALIALWRHRRGLLIGLVCVMAVATVPFLYDKSAMNHRLSEAQEPWQRAPDSLPGKSLVIVRDSGPYLLHLNPFSQNGTRSRRPGAVRGRQGARSRSGSSTTTPIALPTSNARASRGSTTRSTIPTRHRRP